MRHFDAHAYRTEDQEGVWDFAAGCMRTYLILKEKVNQFNEDSEIQGILAEVQAKDTELEALISGYSKDKAQKLRSTDFDPDEIASKGCSYEKLDQLTVEILLGVR